MGLRSSFFLIIHLWLLFFSLCSSLVEQRSVRSTFIFNPFRLVRHNRRRILVQEAMTPTTQSDSEAKAGTSKKQRIYGTFDDSKMVKRTEMMNERAKGLHPLTDDELADIIKSVANIRPKEDDGSSNDYFDELSDFLREVSHLSHKDWKRTMDNGMIFGGKLKLNDISTNTDSRYMLQRILTDGNWDGALHHATILRADTNHKPWAVLVTGVK